MKNPPAMEETPIRFLGQEGSPGGGHGSSFQYSSLENSIDRGAWQATVHGITESDMTEATDNSLSRKDDSDFTPCLIMR